MKRKKDISFKVIDNKIIPRFRGGRSESIHKDKRRYTRKRKHKNEPFTDSTHV